MYRSAAAKRLLSSSKSKSKSWVSLYGKQSSYSSQQPIVSNRIIIPSSPFHSFGYRFLSTTQPPTLTGFVDQTPNSSTSQQGTQEEGVFGDTNTNASSTTTSSQGEGGGARRSPRANSNYQEEQSRVLAASLPHVFKLGWSEAAMIAGARDVSLSPSIVGSIPNKEAALVEYFMDECLQKLIDEIDSGKLQLQDLVPSDRIAKLVKTRLEIQAPYISKWPQALSIQAQPLNFSTSFKQRAMLVDEFCHAASDEGTGVDWYLKRTVLGGIYSSTEIYMLTDNSTDFQDTWTFLNDRVRDAFDLKKTFQEVKYFTEAVGAGVGGSFQGFMKKGC
ncbi:COQ9-like protein [Artemisia annua]|uniref:Ubiquinone biosynthesis protein n=1 Tax=Artemisia annua TaxID=35608 RepID=A0A2U1P6D5_ARTAN|nr:COQ9-like protein [Artemisia annua]